MRIEPLRDHVWVALDHDDGADATSAGLLIVRSSTPPAWRGTVGAVGPDVRDAEPGQRVVLSRLQGIEVAGGVLAPESAILATLEPLPPSEPQPDSWWNAAAAVIARVETAEPAEPAGGET